MNIAKEVYDIVSSHASKKPEALFDELYLEQDIKMVGDDIVDLLEEIQEKLSVDFSELNFSLHFSPEAGWSKNPEFGYYPVTIGHLVKVASLKSWFLPERNEANFLRQRKRTIIFKTAVVLSVFILVSAMLFFQ